MPDQPVVSQADIAQAQLLTQQAAATNAAYLANTLPVLPAYAPGGGAQYTQAEQADAAREAAKHAAAFHPAEFYGVSPSALGNVPLSQIAARYGEGMADLVQGYFTQHPTAEAQAITQQYAANRGGSVENPYDPNSAAGIAWLVNRQGGPVSASLAGKAFGEGYQGNLSAVSGISTTPIRDLSSGMLSGSKMVAGLPDRTITTYMPYGEFAQVKMEGTKVLMDYQTGELGVYQKPYGHSQYMLTGGGSRAALQSGMFTIERPETPYVVSQERTGTYNLPSGQGMSRLGAEAYGGFVRPLSSENLLAPNSAISRYYGAGTDINLANYVQQIPAEKGAVPGAKIPWEIAPSTPALSYMSERGVIPGSAVTLPGEGRLVGSKMVGGTATFTTEPSALPAPFLSTSAPAASENMTVFGIVVPKPLADISRGLTGFESSIRSYLPAPAVGESAVRTAEYANPFMAPAAIASTLTETFNPRSAGEARTAEALTGLSGQYTQFYERPALAVTSYALGAGFGLAGKGVTALEDYARASAAERIISQGGAARSAEQFSGFVMETAPKVLGGLYAADVGVRSTQGLTNFSPESVASRARGIAIQETAPMGAGFVRGYETPGAVYSRVEPAFQRAKLEFPQFVEEAGGSVAKAIPQYAGYKISQTPAYEAATAPLTRAKLEIPQFIEEAGGSTAKGLAGYAQYKVERPIANIQARVDVGLEKLLYPSRFRGVEGTENIYQPRSTLNIFGRETPTTPARKLTGEQEPIPKGTVEVRSSSGMVQLARVEQMPVSRMEQPMQAMESRMMPEYPRGPSPFSTQKYSIEEETQYFVLPPGMTSPGPKRATVQDIVAIPATAMGQVSAQVIAPAQRVGSEVISRQVTQQVPRSDIGLMPRTFQTPWQAPVTRQERAPALVPALTPFITPMTTPFTVPVTTPMITPVTTPMITPMITPVTTPVTTLPPYSPPKYPTTPGVPPAIGVPPILPGFGGGAAGGGGQRKRRAAFMETFMMGLDLSLAGRRTSKAKTYTRPKKKSKRSKK